jgi:CBS domain-containing protein
MICPYCDHENIDGADTCEACQESLANLDLPVPATAVERSLLTARIGKLVSGPPLTVTPDTPVRDVLRFLDQHSLGSVLVVEDLRLVGIFTERDALQRVGENARELADEPISRHMTQRVESLEMEAKIAFAVHRMDLGGYRHVPIVNSTGRPVGVISVRDILRYLTRKLSER